MTALLAFAGCGDKGGFPDAGPIDAAPPGGTITLAWKFADDGTPVTDSPCERLGAVAVRVTATPIDTVQGDQWSIDCDEFQGTSPELLAATYNLRIETLGVGLTVLGDPLNETGVVVESGQDTSIGEVTFDVPFVGSVTFTINTREMAGNCADPGSNGAGLTGLSVSLRDNLLNCKNATFEIPDGSGTFTYDDTCPGPPPVAVDLTADDCIESDVTITIRDVESGPARLLINGFQNGTDVCYLGDFSFSVIGAGQTFAFGERVIVSNEGAGCTYPEP
ncbi:MAG: hypothetical protein KJO07_00685 [Deltaproteobacteria bacterium]|nr:hypothetical protein [Deltaproteobacteria bacterium]